MAHPHEYALVYGSPVPGYAAPEATIGPAGRVGVVLCRIVADGVASGAIDATSDGSGLDATILPGLAAELGLPVGPDRVGRGPRRPRLDEPVRPDQLRAVRPHAQRGRRRRGVLHRVDRAPRGRAGRAVTQAESTARPSTSETCCGGDRALAEDAGLVGGEVDDRRGHGFAGRPAVEVDRRRSRPAGPRPSPRRWRAAAPTRWRWRRPSARRRAAARARPGATASAASRCPWSGRDPRPATGRAAAPATAHPARTPR